LPQLASSVSCEQGFPRRFGGGLGVVVSGALHG
jgi:hypothetical protein